jgi:hypothetical protein
MTNSCAENTQSHKYVSINAIYYLLIFRIFSHLMSFIYLRKCIMETLSFNIKVLYDLSTY